MIYKMRKNDNRENRYESYSYAPQDTVSTKTVVQVVGSSVTGNQKEECVSYSVG